MQFSPIPHRFNVQGIQAELAGIEWNAITLRSEHPRSPHREVDDLWVRYNPIENYHGDMTAFNAEHEAKWYSVADRLPEVKRVAEELYSAVGGIRLGFVLITRIKPGKQCYPHIDGGWHASYYDKYCVSIKANGAMHFENDEIRTNDGDCFWFDNSKPHWVTNQSSDDRISMIVCIRSK